MMKPNVEGIKEGIHSRKSPRNTQKVLVLQRTTRRIQ